MRTGNGSSRSLDGDAVSSFTRTIAVHDLTADPASRRLWQPGSGMPSLSECVLETGWASPMGYWFSKLTDNSGTVQSPYTVRVITPGVGLSEEVASLDVPRGVGRRFRTQVARLKGNASGLGHLAMTITPNFALVETDELSWQALSEPVLLAIAQVWRFQAIEAQFDRLTDQARCDATYADAPSFRGLWRSRKVAERGHGVRLAILDLPHFQGALTDPRAYCSSPQSARAFDLLARRLQLEPWSDAIDDRATAVESIYEAATDKLYHMKMYLIEIFLEILIILILLADVASHFFIE